MWLGEVLREWDMYLCNVFIFSFTIVLSLPFAMQPSSEGVFVSIPACTSA